jgi:hypothetical protein
MARSSRLIFGNPEPLTVFTNFPLRVGTPSSKSSLPGTSIWCENRLRLRKWRWAELLLVNPESFADKDAALIGVLFVVDLNADVAIWGKNLNQRGSKAGFDEDRRGFDEFLSWGLRMREGERDIFLFY